MPPLMMIAHERGRARNGGATLYCARAPEDTSMEDDDQADGDITQRAASAQVWMSPHTNEEEF